MPLLLPSTPFSRATRLANGLANTRAVGDACGVGATCGVGGTSIVDVAAGVASGEVADAAGAGALLKTRPNKDVKMPKIMKKNIF